MAPFLKFFVTPLLTIILKTGRSDNIGSAVIISGVSKAVQNRLVMTAEAMLSKRPVKNYCCFVLAP